MVEMKIAAWLVPILLFVPWTADAQGTSAPASAAAPLAIGETFTVPSAVLGETRRINVYAPPAYVASKDSRLPVLYMPDGGMAEDFLHVAGLVQVLTGNGTMRPFLLVGIENTQRRRDLSGPTQNTEDRKIAPVVGGSAPFRQFIKSELMPVITARYRTTGETAIIGESLAGLFVVETLYLDPDMFDTYIAFDPSLWWNDNALVAGAGARLQLGWTKPKRLYLASSGEKQLAPLAKDLADKLAAHKPANLTWRYDLMANETHATIYHPAAIKALREFFPPK
jgi:predicted alpha/beta superfamily hydrolase